MYGRIEDAMAQARTTKRKPFHVSVLENIEVPGYTPHLSDLSIGDQQELAKFSGLLQRRAAHPNEPIEHSYAEVYGEVVYDEPFIKQPDDQETDR
jgi:hypothetical protein